MHVLAQYYVSRQSLREPANTKNDHFWPSKVLFTETFGKAFAREPRMVLFLPIIGH